MSTAGSFAVLVVGHTYMVGVNQQKWEPFAALGTDISLLVPKSWPSRDWKRTFLLELPRGLRTFAVDAHFAGRTGGYLLPLAAMLRVLGSGRPAVLHVEQEVFALSTFQMAVCSRLTGIPLTVFCWENEDHDLGRLRKWTRRFVLRTASLIIAGNQDAADLVRRWGYRGRLEVMPQIGVDPRFFRYRGPRPGSRFRIGYVGRLVAEKGVADLLDAVAALRRARRDCTLLVCGTGPEEAALRERASALGIAEWVCWQPAVPHNRVPEVLSAVDVLVLPSRRVPGRWREQFGHVLIEAMSMGIPAVGSDSGEIPRVIGRDDLIFPEGDSAALAGVLDRLMLDPGALEEAGRRAAERVAAQFTHERIASRLVACWRELSSACETQGAMP